MKNPVFLNKQFVAVFLFSVGSLTTLHGQTTNNPSPYCGSEFFGNYNMFNNIKIQGSQLNFGAEGNWTNGNDYSFFNAFNFPALTKGENATIELNVYSVEDIEPIYFALWIDFNHNNTFDSNELVMSNSNTIHAALPVFDEPEIPITKTIVIPGNAVVGITRARLVRGNNLADVFGPYDPFFELSPCNSTDNGNNSFGNTYDFNLNIVEENLGTNDFTASNERINFFPNPARETISFNNVSPNAYSIFYIQDALGKTVKTIDVNSELTNILLSDLEDGLYYILSTKENQNILLDKLIIKH